MFARFAFYSAPGVSREKAVVFFRDKVLGDLGGMEGFQEAMLLVSDDTDEVLAVSLWDSIEHMRAAEEKTAPHRAARDRMGGKRSSMQVYEVAYRAP